MSVSHSRIKTARRCWKKHDYRYNQRLATKAKAAPLLRGTIIHEMIDAFVDRKDPFAVSKEYAVKYKQMFREQREEYGDDFMGDIDRIFKNYQRTYKDDKLKYERSEEEFRVELPNGSELIYIIDKIAIDPEGRRWIMDHKVPKNIPDEDARFSDIQLVLYYWAENKRKPKRPIDGVLWDYIRAKAPTIPEQLKNGGLSQAKSQVTDYYTYTAELSRLRIDPKPYQGFLAELKKRGSADFFQRIRLPTPDKSMVKSVVADAAETAEQIEVHGTELFARNLTRDCRWDCEFFKLCHAEMRGLDADFVRKTHFEVRDAKVSEKVEA